MRLVSLSPTRLEGKFYFAIWPSSLSLSSHFLLRLGTLPLALALPE